MSDIKTAAVYWMENDDDDNFFSPDIQDFRTVFICNVFLTLFVTSEMFKNTLRVKST